MLQRLDVNISLLSMDIHGVYIFGIGIELLLVV